MLNADYEMRSSSLQEYIHSWVIGQNEEQRKKRTTGSLSILFVEVNTRKQMEYLSTLFDKYIEKKPYEIVFVGKDEQLLYPLLVYKPLYFLRLQLLDNDLRALKTMIEQYQQKEQFIVVKSGNAMVRLDSRSIQYIESFGHYVLLHTCYGQYRIRDKLTSFIETTQGALFQQTHKSYAVNMDYVECIEQDEITLRKVDEKIAIGRKYKQEVMDKFYQRKSREEIL